MPYQNDWETVRKASQNMPPAVWHQLFKCSRN